MTPDELLGSAIAVVYDPLSTPGNFSTEALRSLLRPPLSIYPPMDSFRMASHRDQVEVLQSPHRTEVRDLSWNIDQASTKLPELLTGILGLLGDLTVRSYEIFFYLEQEMTGEEPLGGWLGQRILRDEFRTGFSDHLSCDIVTFSYEEDSKTHGIEIELAGQSRFMLRSYVSEPVDQLLGSNELRNRFNQERQRLVGQLTKVGIK